jgi:hypothetical protein
MAEEIKVRVGRKATEAEAKAVPAEKRGALTATPPKTTGDVEGQHNRYGAMICPWCGAIGYGWINDHYYQLFTCHCCGGDILA